MEKKKFRLTLKKARELAVQEFGTAKGLRAFAMPGYPKYYKMQMGNLRIDIYPDSWSDCIVLEVRMEGGYGTCMQYFDPETLQQNCTVQGQRYYKDREASVKEWAEDNNAKYCHAVIDHIFDS